MPYRDISTETTSLYRLAANEKVIFSMENRTGEITIELMGPGAAAYVFASYTGNHAAEQSLRLTQKHLAPDTTSSVLVKAALDGGAKFHYDGLVYIAEGAHRSDASQESRSLLLSPDARASARPALEILNHDVVCRHAATTSPIDHEIIFFMLSRGVSKKRAVETLVKGFFQDIRDRVETLRAADTTTHHHLPSR